VVVNDHLVETRADFVLPELGRLTADDRDIVIAANLDDVESETARVFDEELECWPHTTEGRRGAGGDQAASEDRCDNRSHAGWYAAPSYGLRREVVSRRLRRSRGFDLGDPDSIGHVLIVGRMYDVCRWTTSRLELSSTLAGAFIPPRSEVLGS
jgi:hypothetical protein